jgi:hypothetical protein
VLNVGLDYNDNEIVDVWEMPLAQKFCPVLYQPKNDSGAPFGVTGTNYTLRPIPVQAMDTNGDGILNAEDVYVDVYNTSLGQFVGRWKMSQITVQGQPYSNRYPDLVKPSDQLNFQPPGKAWGAYAVLTLRIVVRETFPGMVNGIFYIIRNRKQTILGTFMELYTCILKGRTRQKSFMDSIIRLMLRQIATKETGRSWLLS